jgi:hypothetical protein
LSTPIALFCSRCYIINVIGNDTDNDTDNGTGNVTGIDINVGSFQTIILTKKRRGKVL